MIILKLSILISLLLSVVYGEVDDIDYHVIGVVNNNNNMAVIVDDKPYPLRHSSDSTILYSGEAPAAKVGYRYAKVNKENKVIAEESFLRPPTYEDTYNEFFNRTWNNYTVSPLPTLYKPIKPKHRINTDLHKPGEIPTIHLRGNQTEFDILNHNITLEDYTVVTSMTYISLDDEETFDGVELSLSGRSSTWFAKKSYSLKLKKSDDLDDYRRIKLRALASDPSYMREKIAYDVVKSVGLAATGFSYCRVIMNDQELGLFGLIENYKNPWLANEFAYGMDNYKNGNLYQGLFTTPKAAENRLISDLSYHDNVTDYSYGQYEIKEEAEKDVMDYQPLQALTKFINEAPSTSANAVAEWNKHIDSDSVLRSIALEILLGSCDGYLTMADNYYVYDNPDTNAFVYIPSDLDFIMGSGFFPEKVLNTPDYTEFPGFTKRPLSVKMMAVPVFKDEFEGLLVNITKRLFNPNSMENYINDLAGMLKEDVAWDKTLPRVSESSFDQIMSSAGSFAGGEGMMEVISEMLGDDAAKDIESDLGKDFVSRLVNDTIPFEKAVYGPLNQPSIMSIKGWIQNRTMTTAEFFGFTV